jgi:hypothetical protein
MDANPQRLARFRPTEAQRFPAEPLSKALDQARLLYKIAQSTPIPVPAAAKRWGYTEKSSGGPQTVACLKMYGLLQDSGSGQARRVRLSENAIKIIRDPRDISQERDSLVGEAAVRPSLHRAIIDHFGGTLPPSDEALKTYLVFDVGLRDDAVNDCMRVFAETMAFAKIGGSDMFALFGEPNSGNSGDVLSEPEKSTDPASIQPPAPVPLGWSGRGIVAGLMEGERELTTGLLSRNSSFRLIVSGPVGVKEIERLIRKLQLDKEILAAENEESDDVSALRDA